MADILTKSQRSFNMSRIRSGKTLPEQIMKRILIDLDIKKFKERVKDLSGKPDFYLLDHKIVIFIDGCFWHKCKKCYISPKTNKKFWEEKISTNVERDIRVTKVLNERGIKVIRIWEHELKNPDRGFTMNLMQQIENDKEKQTNVLDLFAGAGGLSEGFIRAGCNMIGHVEMDKDSCSTLTTRMIYHALIKKGRLNEYKNYILGKISRDDLIKKYGLEKERDSVIQAKIGKDNYQNIINEIKLRLGKNSLDIIVGGPPCQAYSYIGRARDDNNMRRDERNFLYKYYVEFLKAFHPKIFVFENVPGLISAGGKGSHKGRYLRDMRRLMKEAGYETNYKILNAADYGVPQNRKRVILVGWNKKSKLKSYPEFQKVERNYLVNDFICGLPCVKAGGGENLIEGFSAKGEALNKGIILTPGFDMLMDHISRPNNEQDLKIYRLAVLAKQKGENIKYNRLPKELKSHSNEKGFLDRFKVVDNNAKGSHTVVAHIAKDGHFYIHPDLGQNRSLTIREAARLQTFPDDYKFEGARGSRFKQIGNAVPPLFSTIIAMELKKYL